MAFIENLSYILIGFVALVSIFLIVLTVLEKKLHIKFLRGKYARNEIYIERIARINVDHPIIAQTHLGNIAKMFFKEAFHIKGNPDFSQIENFFKKKNNKKATEFSKKMSQLLYSKTKTTPNQIQSQIKLLAEIITSNKIISKEEKIELDKKSRQNQSILRKIHIPGISKEKNQNK